MKTACLVAACLVAAGCNGSGGWQIPSQRYIYNLACENLHAEKSVPADARPAPMEEAKVGVGKNAASVDLPYTFTDASGRPASGSHTFWIKRVARTWTIERTHPTAVYTDTPPVEAGAPPTNAAAQP